MSWKYRNDEVSLLDSSNQRRDLDTAVETLSAASSLGNSANGKTFILSSATEFNTNLPAPALGLRMSFIVGAAPSGASYTVTAVDAAGSAANLIHGVGLSSADAGGSASSTAGTAVDVITFVDGQAKVGDRVDLVCNGALWFATGVMSDEDAITFA